MTVTSESWFHQQGTGKRTEFVAVIGIVLFFLVIHIVWQGVNTAPPLWDMAGHATNAVEYAGMLEQGEFLRLFRDPIVYPPFTYAFTGLLFLVFGLREAVLGLALGSFLLLYLVALWFIAAGLSFNRAGRILAVAFGLLPPIVAHFSRVFDLEFPLLAITAASLACLLQSRQFSRRGWSWTFWMFVAAGFFTKWTFFLFLIGPVVIVFPWRSFFRKPKQYLATVVLPVLLAAIVVGGWYVPHWTIVRKGAENAFGSSPTVPYADVFSIGSLAYYPLRFHSGLSLAGVGLVLLGAGALFSKHRRALLIIGSAVLIPLIALTLLPSKESRHILPAYASLIVLAAGIGMLRSKILRPVAVLFSVVILAAFTVTSTGWFVNFRRVNNVTLPSMLRTYGFAVPNVTSPAYGFTWPVTVGQEARVVVDHLIAIWQEDGEKLNPVVVIVPNSFSLNAQIVQWYGSLRQFPANYAYSRVVRTNAWPKAFERADYVVVKSGNQRPQKLTPYLDDVMAEEEKGANGTFAAFTLRDRLWMSSAERPGIVEVRIYGRTGVFAP